METNWTELLTKAVNEPGVISEAYRTFYGYSIGNQLLAMLQCGARGITPGPIATFMRWKELGRSVKKGEKAIMLCMPVTCKRTVSAEDDNGQPTEKIISFPRFMYRNNWFVLAQTEGAEYETESIPDWSESAALETLGISRIDFVHSDGNVQGYAQKRNVAINPVASLPHKTLFHELAHVVLGHTAESELSDSGERTPKDIRELEAESVALICCASLGLPGEEFSRGYIQSWFSGKEVPERSAQKIFHAADVILKAGRKQSSADES